ncbi:uncharacterized protein LOC112466105 isoform X1 [Temnothorax curvispinosus]|uniref:Odorant receptor n=1 Tax=Temnothorax curvispinosus TaxID=300111 RepID=A0A6J1R3Y4_9HYME|nr:uncharacterized protein LOC112466105 isoform X1 [Temnothorax curvispinosus]
MNALFDTRYYNITKLFASMVGIWPYQSQFRKKIIQSVSMFVMFTFFPPQVKRLYDVWGKDIDAVCMCIPPIVTILVSMTKVVTSVRCESQVKELLRQIEMDWKINPTAKEYEILVNYTSKGRTLCIVYSTMLCNGLMCFIMTPVISPILDVILPHNGTRARSLAYDLDYGIDVQTHWLWLWLHSSTTSTATILNIIGADLMYVTLTVHSCCLFAIVRHKLEHVADSIKKHTMQSLENHNYNVECYIKYEDRQLRLKEQAAVVRECVINHQRAIHCVQLLHCIYTWCFLVILGLNLIIISISAVQLVSRLFQWDGMAMCVMFICGQLTHLFFLSLMAQYLLDQSSNVHGSTYSCFWYNMPVQIQKDIVLILIRSRIPCKIMAGKLFVMSLENFYSADVNVLFHSVGIFSISICIFFALK